VRSSLAYPHIISGRYFNKGVKALDSPHVGHVVRETSDKIAAKDIRRFSKEDLILYFDDVSDHLEKVIDTLEESKETIEISKDQKILIHGGAGGIGSIAIRLARHQGANVATTASTNDMQFVKEMGADEVIDYKTKLKLLSMCCRMTMMRYADFAM